MQDIAFGVSCEIGKGRGGLFEFGAESRIGRCDSPARGIDMSLLPMRIPPCLWRVVVGGGPVGGTDRDAQSDDWVDWYGGRRDYIVATAHRDPIRYA